MSRFLLSSALLVALAASAQEPPQPTAWADAVQASPAAGHPSRFRLNLLLGPAVREIYGLMFYGADVAVEMGADLRSRPVALSGFFDLGFGSTPNGLITFQPRIGFNAEGIWDRLRFGGGPSLSIMAVRRATTGGVLFHLTIGVHLQLTVDISRWDDKRSAFYLGLRGGIDLLGFSAGPGYSDGSPMATCLLVAGFRFLLGE